MGHRGSGGTNFGKLEGGGGGRKGGGGGKGGLAILFPFSSFSFQDKLNGFNLIGWSFYTSVFFFYGKERKKKKREGRERGRGRERKRGRVEGRGGTREYRVGRWGG